LRGSTRIELNPWNPCDPWLVFRNGANTLQFKIKDQDYFLAFVEQEKRWYVFAPTSEGVNRIPVYVDAVKYQKPGILETETSLSS
jgi:hypothetical protein